VIAGWTSLRKKLNGNGWIRRISPCPQAARTSRFVTFPLQKRQALV